LIGGSALIAIFIRRSKVGNTTQTWVRAGNRYVLGEGGLAVTIQGVSSFYPWSCVRDLRFSDHHLLLYVSNKDTIVLPKAAFVDQDVAGFCTELEKLWRQSGRNAPSRDVLPDPSQNIGPITEMPEQSGEGVLELRQVRELTAREQRNFMRLLRKHNARGNANKWYTAVSVAWWIVALWFALSVVAAFDALRPAAPALAWQLAMTAIACCALLFGIGKVNDFIRAKHLRRRDLGGAFLIEADGLRTKSSFGEFKGFWRSIPIMVESDQYLFVMLNDTIGSIIVKSAFDGQDVAAFCMEAQKRWQAGRTAPA
jgi:hypothetical protein